MSIALHKDIRKDETLYIGGLLKTVTLPAYDKIIVLDTSILSPSVLEPQRRKPQIMMVYEARIYGESKKRATKRLERRIQVVNLIEDKSFIKKGIYPAYTSTTYRELQELEKKFEANYFQKWEDSVRGHVYKIAVDLQELRKFLPEVSNLFEANGDFSVAAASLLLGCSPASDDYDDFPPYIIKKLKKLHFERFGFESRKFRKHDSESLLTIL